MNKKEIVIYADKRESKSRIVNILKKNCIVEEKQLDVGDYILSDRVCCERKTASDFVKSIADRRLFTQIENIRDNFERPLLIIEGNELFDNNMKPETIRGALAAIAIDYMIPILWTETQADTARQLYSIAKREQIGSRRAVSIRGKRKGLTEKEQQEFLVSGIPKINKEKSRRLLEKFGSPENVFTASEEDLKQIDGIGDKLAKQIRKLLTSRYG